MNNDPVIDAEALVKTFGSVRALDGLDLTVEAGEVHGFLGPNGAGKSTTIRVVLGLMKASGGRIELFGADPWRQAAALHDRLAYVPGDVALWPGLTGGECLDVLGATHGGVDHQRRRTWSSGSTSTRPSGSGTTPRGTGRRWRSSPRSPPDVELLVLDEPTSGLDPLMERTFQQCVRERRAEGVPCCCPATSWPRWRRWRTG